MQSVYIIKPEGLKHLSAIQSIITNAGLVITQSKPITFEEIILEKLWPQASGDLLAIMKKVLLGKPGEAGIVEGENAVRILRKLCGQKTNPRKCKVETIRNLFGSDLEPEKLGEAVYYYNVIHRSCTQREAECDAHLYHLI